MIYIPALEQGRNVTDEDDVRGIRGNAEDDQPFRKGCQDERHCERVKGAGGHSSDDDQCQHGPIAWRERQESRRGGKDRCGWEQNPAGTEESAQEHHKDAAEHRRHVERGGNPGGFIESESGGAAKVRQAHADQASVQGGDAGAQKNA